MELAGTYTFDAPRELVWQAIMEPDILAKCLPGCEQLERASETEYLGTLNVRVGPVQGRFNGKVELSDMEEPEHFHIEVDGKGAAGFVKGGGDARLEEIEGKTVLTYAGEAQVGGRIASVGQRLLDTSAKSIVRQGLESLDRMVQVQAQPQEAELPVPDIAPPTQAEVAMGVARDLYDEYIPESQRSFIIGALAVAGSFLVVILLLKLLRNDQAQC